MNITNALGSMLGIVPTIAAGAYALKKNRGERNRLQGIADQGGTGAVLAQQAGSAGSRAAMGTAAGQGGQAGGLNLLQGLRSAENVTANATGQAARVGAEESSNAIRQLDVNEIARRQGILKLASGLGSIIPTTAAQMLAAKDQAPTNAPRQDVPGTPAGPSQFFADNLTPNVQPPGGDNLTDPQDAAARQAALDASYAEAPLDQADNGSPDAAWGHGYGSDDEAMRRSVDRNAKLDEAAGPDGEAFTLADEVYAVTRTPEYESLKSTGMSHMEALGTIRPDLATALAAEKMGAGVQGALPQGSK